MWFWRLVAGPSHHHSVAKFKRVTSGPPSSIVRHGFWSFHDCWSRCARNVSKRANIEARRKKVGVTQIRIASKLVQALLGFGRKVARGVRAGQPKRPPGSPLRVGVVWDNGLEVPRRPNGPRCLERTIPDYLE